MSQKLFSNCDMKAELKNLVLERIKREKLGSFSCFDFTDLANYKTISKCLERLEDEHKVHRIISGIYCLNIFDKTLGIQVFPSIDNIVQAIGRKNNWVICPTGSTALNAFGLSTQVSASYSYLSSGPYRQYEIFGNMIRLKRTMNREITGYSPITNLTIQCIKELSEDQMREAELNFFRKKLTKEEKITIKRETMRIPTWIRNIISLICEETE